MADDQADHRRLVAGRRAASALPVGKRWSRPSARFSAEREPAGPNSRISPLPLAVPAAQCRPPMTAHKPGDPLTLNRLYGRSSGHKLRKGQAELVETLLPQIAVPAEGEVTAERLFGDDRPLHLEIGFGSRRASRLPRRHAARPWLHRLRAVPQRGRDRARPCPRPGTSPMSGCGAATRSTVLDRVARRRAELSLSAPPRPLAQGAPRQAADGQ